MNLISFLHNYSLSIILLFVGMPIPNYQLAMADSSVPTEVTNSQSEACSASKYNAQVNELEKQKTAGSITQEEYDQKIGDWKTKYCVGTRDECNISSVSDKGNCLATYACFDKDGKEVLSVPSSSESSNDKCSESCPSDSQPCSWSNGEWVTGVRDEKDSGGKEFSLITALTNKNKIELTDSEQGMDALYSVLTTFAAAFFGARIPIRCTGSLMNPMYPLSVWTFLGGMTYYLISEVQFHSEFKLKNEKLKEATTALASGEITYQKDGEVTDSAATQLLSFLNVYRMLIESENIIARRIKNLKVASTIVAASSVAAGIEIVKYNQWVAKNSVLTSDPEFISGSAVDIAMDCKSGCPETAGPSFAIEKEMNSLAGSVKSFTAKNYAKVLSDQVNKPSSTANIENMSHKDMHTAATEALQDQAAEVIGSLKSLFSLASAGVASCAKTLATSCASCSACEAAITKSVGVISKNEGNITAVEATKIMSDTSIMSCPVPPETSAMTTPNDQNRTFANVINWLLNFSLINEAYAMDSKTVEILGLMAVPVLWYSIDKSLNTYLDTLLTFPLHRTVLFGAISTMMAGNAIIQQRQMQQIRERKADYEKLIASYTQLSSQTESTGETLIVNEDTKRAAAISDLSARSLTEAGEHKRVDKKTCISGNLLGLKTERIDPTKKCKGELKVRGPSKDLSKGFSFPGFDALSLTGLALNGARDLANGGKGLSQADLSKVLNQKKAYAGYKKVTDKLSKEDPHFSKMQSKIKSDFAKTVNDFFKKRSPAQMQQMASAMGLGGLGAPGPDSSNESVSGVSQRVSGLQGSGGNGPSAANSSVDWMGKDMWGEEVTDEFAAPSEELSQAEGLDKFEYNQSDINKKPQTSIFKILSNRFHQSGIPRLFKKKVKSN